MRSSVGRRLATVATRTSGARAHLADRDSLPALTSFLHGRCPSEVDPELLVKHGMAGYAVTRLAHSGRTVDPLLQSTRLTLVARHAVIKRAITRLVAAWAAAGIEAMLFKGFALAEFVYPEPSWRAYSDVDVALRDTTGRAASDIARRAAEVAESLGLTVEGRPEVSSSFDSLYGESYNGPAMMQIADQTGGIAIDVHSRIVHNRHDESRGVAKAAAITMAVWERSEVHELAGVKVRMPAAVDSAVVGLALSRSWSTDASRLRARDYLDLDVLLRSGTDIQAVLQRARELGCTATVRLFLRRCDPITGKLDLRPPNALTRLLYDSVHAPERGHRTLAVRAHEARHLPERLRATWSVMPNVYRHLRLWGEGAPDVWPAEGLPDGDSRLDRDWWRLTQFALRRAFQLSGVIHPERRPDLALACLLFALREHGVSATRLREGGADTLELNGERLRPTVLGIRRATSR